MIKYNYSTDKKSVFENEKNKLNFFASDSKLINGADLLRLKTDLDNTKIRSKIDEESQKYSPVSIGIITICWNKNAVPDGWHLCDGTNIDDLENVNTSEKNNLKSILDSNNLPLINYPQISLENIGSMTLLESPSWKRILISLAKKDEKYMSSHYIENETKRLNFLKPENIPFHSHIFSDYFSTENWADGPETDKNRLYNGISRLRTTAKRQNKIGNTYNGTGANKGWTGYNCLYGNCGSYDSSTNVLGFVNNKTSGMLTTHFTDSVTRDGYYGSEDVKKMRKDDWDAWREGKETFIFDDNIVQMTPVFFIIKIK